MAAPAPAAGHRRNKPSSVLKSIIVPKSSKQSPADGSALSNNTQPDSRPYNPAANMQAPPLLPPDHPHSQLRAAHYTQNIPSNPPSPRKSQDVTESPRKGLHKKTLSSVSLRSLGKEKEKEEKAKKRQSRDASRTREGNDLSGSPKKAKSRTNLTAMFHKEKQSKEVKQTPGRDKENTTPPSSASANEPVHTPIWAQFSSQQPLQEVTKTSKIPLNDERRSIEEEIALYTPRDYSPSKQRNFFDYGQPSLQQRAQVKERPKSTIVTGSASTASLFESLTHRKSNDRAPLADTKGNGTRIKESASSKSIATPRKMLQRSTTDDGQKQSPSKQAASPSKKPNRVMAAVAAFNGKAKQSDSTSTSPTKLDPSKVEADFEEVLASRNIPTHQRAQMRTLKLEVKADFVRTHKLDTPQASRATSSHSSIAEPTGKQSSKPVLTRSSKSRDGSAEDDKGLAQTTTPAGSTKRERPRSRTFTFNRSDSPTKKQKGDGTDRKASSKAAPIPRSPSSRSLASNGSQRSVSKGSKTVMPNEFITYLKNTPKPQDVEIGKLHKLRLLLRNETVEWVNTFIQDGGMTELVGLLHRIMGVEWREDHEDTLLHELLRCLKGLCTTDSALKQLAGISSTLYPALLAMLFDEEHKGPSDFTTRELIIQIIFAHISTAPQAEGNARASELLRYLKDPVKEKESSTVPFILQMHQPRPYQVWCKEITNVTKEVFWIFIHHLNVIPVPPISDSSDQSYTQRHFPGQRAIVPAAPYVGGVEWDATNYIATHLDLLNGLIASLPTREARNNLRSELKVSGFEKLMGHLRACNPKYYGAVHDSAKVWIGAATEDEWDVKTVRMGGGDGKGPGSPVKQSPQKKQEKAPQIEIPNAPKMDVGLGLGLGGFDRQVSGAVKKDDNWI